MDAWHAVSHRLHGPLSSIIEYHTLIHTHTLSPPVDQTSDGAHRMRTRCCATHDDSPTKSFPQQCHVMPCHAMPCHSMHHSNRNIPPSSNDKLPGRRRSHFGLRCVIVWIGDRGRGRGKGRRADELRTPSRRRGYPCSDPFLPVKA